MTFPSSLRPLSLAALACAAFLAAGAPLAAQGLFSPAIAVNDKAVTNYEISQRALLLGFFGQRGDLTKLARTQLVDDILRNMRLEKDGFSLTQEAYAKELATFAGNNNLVPDQLLATMRQAGIEEPTFRAYLSTNAAWRDYIRARFASRVDVNEAELDAFIARNATASGGVELLLSEFIVPLVPEHMAEIREIVENVRKLTSTEAFSAAAAEYSVVPSRENGGRLDWAPASNFPPALANVLLGLEDGQVTPPLDITNGVALIQKRGQREGRVPAAQIVSVDYARFSVASADIATAAFAKVATCDDLYSHLPAGVAIERQTLAPAQLPQTIALATAKLDPNEWVLAAQEPESVTYVMLCARTPALGMDGDREGARAMLQSQKLQSFSDGLLAEMRAHATIVQK